MANFALFAGDFGYPAGGWHDLIGTFETVTEAKERYAQGRDRDKAWATDFEWGQIVDMTYREMLLETIHGEWDLVSPMQEV
jgi:hypothetical protein